jgi:hypothetical protein
VPLDSPDRFLVEVLFSNGANFDPTRVVPLANDHTLPVVPRAPLHTGAGVPLQRLAALLEPCAAPRKSAPSTYALQVGGGGGGACCCVTAPRLTPAPNPCTLYSRARSLLSLTPPSSHAPRQVALRAPLSTQVSSQAPSRAMSGIVSGPSFSGLSSSAVGSSSNLSALARQGSAGGASGSAGGASGAAGGNGGGGGGGGGSTVEEEAVPVDHLDSVLRPIDAALIAPPGAMP